MKLPLHWKIAIGLLLGTAWSYAAIALGWKGFTLDWIEPFGQIFLRLLKFIAVPLVLFSILSGISDLADSARLGRLGLKTLAAYLITTVLAVGLGLVLGNLVGPGARVDDAQRIANRIGYEAWAAETGTPIKDGRSVRTDPAHAEAVAAYERRRAEAGDAPLPDVVAENLSTARDARETGPLQFVVDMVPSNIFDALVESSMLQVIFFALFFGIAMLFAPPDKVAPLKRFIDGTNEVFLKMVDVVMQAAPFFVFALMAGILAKMADTPAELVGIFRSLGWYALTVVLGLGLMIYVVYPLILRLLVRDIGYADFFRSISPAQLLAFSSSSSAATLPVTMDCVRENLGVSPQVSSFVLPIGATVNMDGTSLYQAVGVLFLAQFHYVDLDMTQQLTIVLTATLASIGSAAVPSAGLIMMMVVLISVGLPAEWVAIILTIDRPLDMMRTVVNVTGDATVSSVIAKSEGELAFRPKPVIDNLELERPGGEER
jgi:Na+/H+-dicarboxylate symporter